MKLKFLALSVAIVAFGLVSCSKMSTTPDSSSMNRSVAQAENGQGDVSLGDLEQNPSAAQAVDQELQSDLTNNLRIGEIRLSPDKDNNRIVVLAADRSQEVRPLKYTSNLSKIYGFSSNGVPGNNLEKVDVKFLLTANDAGIQSVRSFEMGGPNRFLSFLKKPFVGSVEKRPGLPPELINMHKAQRQLLAKDIIDMLPHIPSPQPSMTIRTIFSVIKREDEQRKLFFASYLESVAKAFLDPNAKNYEILGKFFKPEEVRDLLCGLAVRFNRNNTFAGLLTTAKKRGAYCDTYFAEQNANENYKMDILNEMATDKDLVVQRIDDVVLLSAKNPGGKFNSSVFNMPYSDKVGAGIDNAKSQLTPLAFIYLDEKGNPLELVELQHPLAAGHREKISRIKAAAKTIGFSFLPIGSLYFEITAADGLLNFVLHKKGSTDLVNGRVRGWGDLAAMAELSQFSGNAIQVNWDKYAKDVYTSYLQGIGAPEEDIQLYQKLLSDAKNDDQLKATMADIVGRANYAEFGASNLLGSVSEDKVLKNKSLNMSRLGVFLNTTEKVKKLDEDLSKLAKTETRQSSWQMVTHDDRSPSNVKTPIILLMVDGLRPDRFRQLIADCNSGGTCLIPHLKSLFGDHGVELESYTPRALTLPSWSTILTGYEQDYHGVRSNEPITRTTGKIENFSDYRKELFSPTLSKQGRAGRQVMESGLPWLAKFYDSSAVDMNLLPIAGNYYSPLFGLTKELAKKGVVQSLFSGSFSTDIALDKSAAETTAADIRKHKGMYRLILNWYSSVDEENHIDNAMLPTVYQTLDTGIGEILDAAKQDPVLQNAKVIMVSDHGHIGGGETATSSSFYKKAFFMNNTGFNLVTYFTGQSGNTDYNFEVKSITSPYPKNDFKYLKEFWVQPFVYSYCRDRKPCGKQHPTALVDFSGDSLAQIYLKGTNGYARRNNFADLSHFDVGQGKTLDVIGDLLNVRRENLSTRSADVAQKVLEVTKGYPVSLMAMPLQEEDAACTGQSLTPQELNKIDGAGGDLPVREPVLVLARGDQGPRTSLIFTRTNPANPETEQDEFRYVVVKNFQQDKNGCVSGEVVKSDSTLDPLGYLGNVVSDSSDAGKWRTDREWLSIATKSGNIRPTAVFSIARTLTLSPMLEQVAARRAEVPDFLLQSNWGYAFHDADGQESDHGGFWREEVRSSFFIGSLDGTLDKSAKVKGPVLTRDIAPTILDYAGLLNGSVATQGRSLKPVIDQTQH